MEFNFASNQDEQRKRMGLSSANSS
jgi:hypothetical protein